MTKSYLIRASLILSIAFEHEPISGPAGGLRCTGDAARRRSHAQPARSALAAYRQARAAVPLAATAPAGADLRARGVEGQGVDTQRLGLVVRRLPRRAPR